MQICRSFQVRYAKGITLAYYVNIRRGTYPNQYVAKFMRQLRDFKEYRSKLVCFNKYSISYFAVYSGRTYL